MLKFQIETCIYGLLFLYNGLQIQGLTIHPATSDRTTSPDLYFTYAVDFDLYLTERVLIVLNGSGALLPDIGQIKAR